MPQGSRGGRGGRGRWGGGGLRSLGAKEGGLRAKGRRLGPCLQGLGSRAYIVGLGEDDAHPHACTQACEQRPAGRSMTQHPGL